MFSTQSKPWLGIPAPVVTLLLAVFTSMSETQPRQPLKQPASSNPTWDHEVRRLGGMLAGIALQELERRSYRKALLAPQPSCWSGDFVTIPNPWAGALADARHDPEGYVARVRVREIGWKLCALGGLRAMQECLAAIENDGTVSYVEAAWSGIGVSANQIWLR